MCNVYREKVNMATATGIIDRKVIGDDRLGRSSRYVIPAMPLYGVW